jgi:dipeptidase
MRDTLPTEIAHCIWIAFGRPDTNAYSPWYVSIPAPPEGYTHGSSDTALQTHFNQPENFFKFNPDYAYWNFSKLSELVDGNYKSHIKIVRKEWKNFENYAIKRLKKMEKEFVYLLEKNRNIAVNIITNFIHKLEYRKWFLASELIDQLEKKKN